MRNHANKRRNRLREIQIGFTLVSTMVSFTLASVALFGGWVAYRDFQMQWRVSNAERQMDQYAHSAMAELVNVISWSSGVEQLASGRNQRWNISLMEQVLEEAGPRGSGLLSYRYPTDMYYLLPSNGGVNGGRIELKSDRDRGILIDRNPPAWAEGGRGGGRQYVWAGRNPRRLEMPAYDRRDRMTLVGFEMDLPHQTLAGSELKKHAVVEITLTMQYRYDASHGVAIFGDEYVRERIYSTKIFCRNWDVNSNPFRDELLASLLSDG